MGMMDLYRYERQLLETTTDIIRTDLATSQRVQRKSRHKGYHLKSLR